MMQAQISVGNRPAAAAGTRLGTYGDLGSFRTALGTFSGRSRAAWGYTALSLSLRLPESLAQALPSVQKVKACVGAEAPACGQDEHVADVRKDVDFAHAKTL